VTSPSRLRVGRTKLYLRAEKAPFIAALNEYEEETRARGRRLSTRVTAQAAKCTSNAGETEVFAGTGLVPAPVPRTQARTAQANTNTALKLISVGNGTAGGSRGRK
jgi:hypothetical protein